MRFDNFFAPNSICTPSRGVILTASEALFLQAYTRLEFCSF